MESREERPERARGRGNRESGPNREISSSGRPQGPRGNNGRPNRMREQMYADLLQTRPANREDKRGSIGKKVALQTNYFRFSKIPNWTLHQYHVDFDPPLDITGAKKYLFRQHKSLFKGFMFDGQMLHTSTKLKDETTVLKSVRASDGEEFTLKVKYIKPVAMTEEVSLMVLNIILRTCMEGLKLQLVGRNFYDALAKQEIPEYKLELWPGYITSVRQHEEDILMCAEVATKVMRKETALDIYEQCARENRGDHRTEFARKIIGTTVLTDYNNKTYRIDDVDFDQTPSSTFETRSKGGEPGLISYTEYYSNRYHLRIRDTKQPLLMSRSTDRKKRAGESNLIALIPELCRVTGITEQMRSDFRFTKCLSSYTRVDSDTRIKRLLDFNRRLQDTDTSMQILSEWNMSLDRDLVEVTGRELDTEKIVYHGENEDNYDPKAADWSRALVNKGLKTVIHLTNWCLVVPRILKRDSDNFVQVLIKSVRGLRMGVEYPKVFEVNNDQPHEILPAIDHAIHSDPQLIMVILQSNAGDKYASIKKRCCIDRAIPTQVIVSRTISSKGSGARGLMSVATKVAIQLNCKLGAAPWGVKIPLSEMMVCGVAVTHDTKNKKRSYGALVTSMDMRTTSSRYFSSVCEHKNGEELAQGLCSGMIMALREYKTFHNGSLPNKILFYRDGVGDGQIPYVFEQEVQQLKATLDKMYVGQQKPYRLAYIIVNKRINTRLFKNRGNPMPGTVVDDVITLPNRYDFYLIPQSCRQGSVSPTAYNVIEDSLFIPPEKLQMLTYKMCHLYYNWSGTIRVPAVCQYAQKLAFLVGQHLHAPPQLRWDNKLYFL